MRTRETEGAREREASGQGENTPRRERKGENANMGEKGEMRSYKGNGRKTT